MPEPQNAFQKRHVAHKVRIFDILKGNFTKDEFSAGYIKLNNINVSRVNIIATVIDKVEALSYFNMFIDDGTGSVQLRSFDSRVFPKLDVSDVILVIGKIREFNNEKYVMPEILKRISNAEWLAVRKLELEKNNILVNESSKMTNEVVVEEIVNFGNDIYLLIKKLDNGDGVSVEEVIKNSNNSNAENIINRLLENGDIFEIKPGKLKVLE